jgi:Ras homolog enriched in brain
MPGDILKKRKIAVLGSRSVGNSSTLTISRFHAYPYVTTTGKSSLVIQFTEDQFIESYYPTIENTFTKSVNYKGVDYDCDIIDTAGQVVFTQVLCATITHLPHHTGKDEYSILNSKHAIGIHGYVLVYSVTSRNSFDMIQIVYDKIINFCGIKEIPCVIVGSKIDLPQRYHPPLLHSNGPLVVLCLGLITRTSDRYNRLKARTLPRRITRLG